MKALLHRADGVMAIALLALALVALVVYAVLFTDCCEDQRANVVQSILLALAAVTGYFLNSTADQRRREERDRQEGGQP